MFRRKFLTAAIVAAVATLTGPAVSQAAFEIKIEQLNVSTGAVIGSAQLLIDNNPGGETLTDGHGSILDNIDYAGTVFGLNITLSGVASQGLNSSTLTQVNTSVDNTTGQTARIRVTATREYTDPINTNLDVKASAAVDTVNNSGFSGTYNAYIDKNGDLFGKDVWVNGGQIQSGQGVAAGGGVLANPGSLWALTEVFDITIDNGGSVKGVSGNMTVNATDGAPTLDAPAPGGLVMALGAVPFLGLIRRRLRKSEAAV